MFSLRFFRVISTLVIFLAFQTSARAQSGLEQSLKNLDRNNNNEIEPQEITPLSRPFMERIAKARRLEIYQTHSIERWREAARIYFAFKNGVDGREIRPEKVTRGVQSFDLAREDTVVPEFGLAEVKFHYTQEDLRDADRSLERYDRDGDGFLSRREAQRGRWTQVHPFEHDANKDDKLSRLELAQRYAKRRLIENVQDELDQKTRRVGTGIESTARSSSQVRRSWSSRDPSDRAKYYFTSTILGRFDKNRNGRLEPDEAQRLGFDPGSIDSDQDGDVSREELHAYLSQLQDESEKEVSGLPSWFYELDVDQDEQVTMSEYAESWNESNIKQFALLDGNGDGILTADEIVRSKSMMGGSFTNESAEVLPPRKTVVSEINVEEDFLIGDLNIQLSITHTNVGYLDAYLVGPEGERVELFTEVGGSGDNFEKTVFDDQSRYPIIKARSPYHGSFQPEALAKRQPSLAQFNGKTIKGVWQLMIRCSRSDRFGMLHGWSMLAKPQESMLNSEGAVVYAQSTQPQTGPTPQTESSKKDPKVKIEKEYQKRLKEEAKIKAKEAWANWYRSKSAKGKPTSDEIREFKLKLETKMKEYQKFREATGGKENAFDLRR